MNSAKYLTALIWAYWVFGDIPRMRMSSIIRSRSGVVFSSFMGSSCHQIEKPQSSDRSARSQNGWISAQHWPHAPLPRKRLRPSKVCGRSADGRAGAGAPSHPALYRPCPFPLLFSKTGKSQPSLECARLHPCCNQVEMSPGLQSRSATIERDGINAWQGGGLKYRSPGWLCA